MGKSKRAPALLEVMQRQQAQGETTPRRTGWGRSQDASATMADKTVDPNPNKAASASAPAESGASVGEPVGAVDAAPAPVAVPAPVRAERPVRRETDVRGGGLNEDLVPPILALEEGRVTISLNPVSTVIAVGGIIVAIFAGYVIGFAAGRHSGSSGVAPAASPRDPLRAAGQHAADPSVLEVKPAPGSAPGGAPETPRAAIPSAVAGGSLPVTEADDPRQPGLNYLVLKDFMKKDGAKAADAVAAERFLKRHRVPVVLETHSWGWRLWDVSQGYTSADRRAKAAEIKLRKEKLWKLSRIYQQQGGQHRFDPMERLYNPSMKKK